MATKRKCGKGDIFNQKKQKCVPRWPHGTGLPHREKASEHQASAVGRKRRRRAKSIDEKVTREMKGKKVSYRSTEAALDKILQGEAARDRHKSRLRKYKKKRLKKKITMADY